MDFPFVVVVGQDLVVEMIRGFHAFAIHGTALPNPSAFYANAAAPESLVKNALNVIVAVISDMIMVSGMRRGLQHTKNGKRTS